MRLLLDTHVLIWWFTGARTLSVEATEAIRQANAVYYSAVSIAEMSNKVAIGKLDVQGDLHGALGASGIEQLDFSVQHGLTLRELELHHRDPFDRMLIAQATHEKLAVMTNDRMFSKYSIPLVPAV